MSRAEIAAQDRAAILETFDDFRDALRFRDGEMACGFMTLPTRAAFRRTFDPYPHGWDSCVELVDALGQSLYQRWWRGVRLARPISNGRYACARIARPANSGAEFFRRSPGVGWQIHETGNDRDFGRFPKRCQ